MHRRWRREGVKAFDSRRTSLARGQGLPEPLLLEDPMEALPPTAQRLLAAARRLLASGGFEALKLSAIAAEAGEAKASIGYHFGNKDGLVTALVDSLAHDANRALIEETNALPPGDARVHALIDGEARIVADAESFQAFFDDPAAGPARPRPARSRRRALPRLPRDRAALSRQRRPRRCGRPAALRRPHDRARRRPRDPARPRPRGRRRGGRHQAVGEARAAAARRRRAAAVTPSAGRRAIGNRRRRLSATAGHGIGNRRPPVARFTSVPKSL